MTDPLKPLLCSECPTPLEHPAVGRPKICCTKACFAKRRNRLRKQEREDAAENRRHLREAFGPGGDLEPGVLRRGRVR